MSAVRPPTGTIDPRQVVADGYDRMADRYLAWSALRPSEARLHALDLADGLIPAGADVLELGCAAGTAPS